MFWRVAALAVLFASTGPPAAQTVDDPGECPGACTRAVGYTLDTALDTDDRGLIEQAMHVWERGTGGRVCFTPGGYDLVVEEVERAEDLSRWDPEWPHHVGFNKGSHVWIVHTSVSDPDKLRALAVHEIGHYLGLTHADDTALTFMHRSIDDIPQGLREHARLPERDRLDFCKAQRCTCAF